MKGEKGTIIAAVVFFAIAVALTVVGFIHRPGSVGMTDKLHGTYGAEGSDLNNIGFTGTYLTVQDADDTWQLYQPAVSLTEHTAEGTFTYTDKTESAAVLTDEAGNTGRIERQEDGTVRFTFPTVGELTFHKISDMVYVLNSPAVDATDPAAA